MLQELCEIYGESDCRDLGSRQLEKLREGIKAVTSDEIVSLDDGKTFIELLRKFREAIAENDKLHGDNYPMLLNSILSVGEDGLYSNNLRFIFELIQNVDDCEYENADDCILDMHFDFNSEKIVLRYNEVGFSPFNVFAITGIAEAAKNISASKNEIGEKGIGFKSVFGVAEKVLIRSGWFSFELYKDNFTIPVPSYSSFEYCTGTEMILFVSKRVKEIYRQIRNQYCCKEALFSKNPLLFLNKLTSLRLYYDSWRSMEFCVSRKERYNSNSITREDNVIISVNLHDYDSGVERDTQEEIICSRYTYPVIISETACKARYGNNTKVGSNSGKAMQLQAVFPNPEYCDTVGTGGLYSFLPTQLAFTIPVVCHAPYKLDASREFVDPQNENEWFKEISSHLNFLLDYAFSDWCKIVKSDIIKYLPGQNQSIFAQNNGKELCLSKQEGYKGSHYLKLPLFFTADGEYQSAGNIFYFDPDDKVRKPELIKNLLSIRKSLFIVPESIKAGKFGISVEGNINNRVFEMAIQDSSKTRECLEYLDAVGYEFSEKRFPKGCSISFTREQLECLLNHKKLAGILMQIAVDEVRNKKRPAFNVCEMKAEPVFAVLYENFDLNETPRIVEQYMNWCGCGCFCINIDETIFLPCHNGVVLSKNNAVASFASFCYSMDSRDTFAIRIKLKEASNQLDKCISTNKGSAADYLRDLCNIRRTVQDSLGKNGYKSYIDLILKSGTDRSRFIQELLQNADDCIYPNGIIPTFTLEQKKGCISTQYNEVGFTRENIRAITAIGESTKNRLLNGDLRSIGEKGVGFKTVFATASEVRIHSGEYHFSLSADAPTIPRIIHDSESETNGTKMEFLLKDKSNFPEFTEKSILELCLCLRKLRNITIGSHSVTIEDTNLQRVVTIDKKQYTFNKYRHSFIITDTRALAERENFSRKISANQEIICYVPERIVSSSEYPVYVGLPTKHKMHIPVVVDAPFELTTSREEIEVDCAAWNSIIREEMYNAIINVIHSRKANDRANVLRFARFKWQFTGNQSSAYFNDISDCEYLNYYDYLNRLRNEPVVPTFNRAVFAARNDNSALRFPNAVCWLLSALPAETDFGIDTDKVIDPNAGTVSKEQKERIESVFNALSFKEADFCEAFCLIEQYAEKYIAKESFRNALYEFLQNTPERYHERVRELKIIPVYGIGGGVQYIRWMDDAVFVKKNAVSSSMTYYILNENLLAKSVCEKMLGVNINEMNAEWEQSKYNEKLTEIITTEETSYVYRYLLNEFLNNGLEKNKSIRILLADLSESIPIKNQLGEIVMLNQIYVCDKPRGYFQSKMLQKITSHAECADFARFLKRGDLNGIHYENLIYREVLTADDVEAFKDNYFLNADEILRCFYRDGFLSDEMLSEYELDYIGVSRVTDYGDEYEFPEDCVGNRAQLRTYVQKLWNARSSIISVKEECTVQKIQTPNGHNYSLDKKEVREETMRLYTPAGVSTLCFCQMCRKIKSYGLIEVNNIEVKPKFYFPQLRVSLCLECSKRFKDLRKNKSIRKDFMDEISRTTISDESTIEIKIGRSDTITFTAKHLAEIQEILRLMQSLPVKTN